MKEWNYFVVDDNYHFHTREEMINFANGIEVFMNHGFFTDENDRYICKKSNIVLTETISHKEKPLKFPCTSCMKIIDLNQTPNYFRIISFVDSLFLSHSEYIDFSYGSPVVRFCSKKCAKNHFDTMFEEVLKIHGLPLDMGLSRIKKEKRHPLHSIS